ncbi:hypothetical protein F5Y18DRAFT_432864 [Xylariaceae sp. FL1019]|nr:hypothetical protein F5Y18DRAFT_432864 [Xylariaceae sp. FL1019]
MSGADILSTLNILIKLGFEIMDRLDSLDRAAEDLQLLNSSLELLLKMFANPANQNIIETHPTEFLSILNILQSIVRSYTKFAKALNVSASTANNARKTTLERGRGAVRRIWTFMNIPDILADIERKTDQLERIYNVVSAVMLDDMRTQDKQARDEVEARQSAVDINEKSTTIIDTSSPQASATGFSNIDTVVGNLISECQNLRERLRNATLFPDTSAAEDYQTLNPEAVSFWKNRFQKPELAASTLRYEALYVSWARFVHEVEKSFSLKRIPTAFFPNGDIDVIREQGSRYFTDPNGTRCLSMIRPLWLPALRSALDPLHKGYVKPQDYFELLRESSLYDILRTITLESSGYGMIVECERASADIALPAVIESPTDHVGWIAAQIVAVPTPDELGIASEQEIMKLSYDDLFARFANTAQDIYFYVRYLETGQIERKSLSNQIRPIGGIAIGAKISVRQETEQGIYAWSQDLHITEFRPCPGGQYVVTPSAGSGAHSTTIVFASNPVKGRLYDTIRDVNRRSAMGVPELDYMLLGPSNVFVNPPRIGEKIQIEFDGMWYDSRVVAVDGDEIEYTDWDTAPAPSPDIGDINTTNEEDGDFFFFPEDQLTDLGKGVRRLWRSWRDNDCRFHTVRPYQCLHIGDFVEAPVMYPDYRFYYHTIENSQLYLPARIIDVHNDEYTIEFSPAFMMHAWWPGRIPSGQQIELIPGSGITVDNPFDANRVTLGMDKVRPFNPGPRPVLGVQSAKPSGWSSFQGVHLHNLENLMERSIWDDESELRIAGVDPKPVYATVTHFLVSPLRAEVIDIQMSSAIETSRSDSNSGGVHGGEDERPPQWPLSFQIQKPQWSYEMYRGYSGQAPELIYCSSTIESEKVASKFLNQKIVGFGVEWVNWWGPPPEDERLQDKVSLIQVASEEKIALFHIAAYTGYKTEDFLAPSLRKVIESPTIIKAASSIMRDFERLETTFRDLGLKPRGAIDVTYLHNLVTYGTGSSDQWKKCTTKPLLFSKQIETHFGMPFEKESTDWSEKFLTKKQQAHAASDAYAGLMLYHYLESKRAAMLRRPPRLLSAELYPWFKYERGVGTQILLVVEWKKTGDTETITVITAKDHLRDAPNKKFQKVFKRSDGNLETGGDQQQEFQTEDIGAGDAVGEQLGETDQDTLFVKPERSFIPEPSQRTPAPTTPPRPPPLTTGLTVAMEKTSFSGFGTEAEPLTLADSSDEDCKAELSDESPRVHNTPSKPQKRKRSEQQTEDPRDGRVRANEYWSSKREQEMAKVEDESE